MGGNSYLPIAAAMVILAFACGDGSDNEPLLGQTSDAPTSSQGPTSENWQLVITRADRTIETVVSSEEPIICGSQEEPNVVFFCGRGVANGDVPPVSWDFVPVNIGAGDTYVIVPPGGWTAAPDSTSPTPTVIAP